MQRAEDLPNNIKLTWALSHGSFGWELSLFLGMSFVKISKSINEQFVNNMRHGFFFQKRMNAHVRSLESQEAR